MKNQIFLQARMGSTRLPGKVLLQINGKTIIEILVERVKKINDIEKIIIVTTKNKRDDYLIREAKRLKLAYFRGSEENVLDRFFKASLEFKPDNIIRITGDCPLMDFDLITRGLKIFKKGDCDILSNHRMRTFPDGIDFEVFKASALKIAWDDNFIKSNEDRERFDRIFLPPTSYLLSKKKFKHKDLISKKNLAHIRLTIDYKEDFDLIKIIYQSLSKQNKYFILKDILRFLKNNAQLLNLNKKYICLDYGLRIEE